MKIVTRSLKKRIGTSLLTSFVLGCIISISFSNYKRSNLDVNLFDRREKYMILYDGKKRDNMINDYGENDFLITYDKKNNLFFTRY